MAAPLHIIASFPRNEPSPFSITFSFDTPFKYDPSKGNLLVEIHVVNGGVGGIPNLDWSSPDGREGVALAQEGSVFGPSLYAPVTQFSYQLIPEPSSFWLFAAGGAAVPFVRWNSCKEAI